MDGATQRILNDEASKDPIDVIFRDDEATHTAFLCPINLALVNGMMWLEREGCNTQF